MGKKKRVLIVHSVDYQNCICEALRSNFQAALQFEWYYTLLIQTAKCSTDVIRRGLGQRYRNVVNAVSL